MIYSQSRPDIALIIGVIAIGLGIMEIFSGEALQGYGRTATRGEDPKTFWKAVSIHYLCGVVGVGYYLYERFLPK
jgi:hypothetical protein